MAFSRDDLPSLGDDYNLERYAYFDRNNPDDLARDPEGNVIWYHGWPSEDNWGKVGMVTLDLDPQGEGKFRNIPISPDEPLDPYGRPDLARDPDYFYDLDDLAFDFDWELISP